MQLMKYNYLKQWVDESKPSHKIVDKCHYSDGIFTLYFVDKSAIKVINIEAESFPLLDDSKHTSPATSLWQTIENCRWTETSIDPKDRILYLQLEKTDIYQQKTRFCLILECILPQPNIILTSIQQDKLIIIEATKKYSFADNPQRQILPRLPYFSPITSYCPESQSGDIDLRIKGSSDFFARDMNEYFMLYYNEVLLVKQNQRRIDQARSRWNKEYKKLQIKLQKQESELSKAELVQTWFVAAETIKHNLNNIQKGDTYLKATNYYADPIDVIEIPLYADKTPLANMQIYLKRYHKAKSGLAVIQNNILQTKQELDTVTDFIHRIDNGEDLDFLSAKASQTEAIRHKIQRLDKLLRISIDADWEIVVGRKATENDMITTQLAKPHDWWFHTRIYHGSHILLRNFHKKEPDPELIRSCCSLAAWYSKAKFSQNVPVDYTQIRFVRKPRKSAPGFVTYSNHNTVFSTPKDLRTVRTEQNWPNER